MINIDRKENCCGCGACFDACVHHAIDWKVDDEGFSYPLANKEMCIKCGLCDKACPILNKDALLHKNKEFMPLVFGIHHKDPEIRFTSTSGGAFWGLAENFVRQGGYVSGAVFCDHFRVRHIIANNLDNLGRIKGSKYCQSDCRGIYKEIRKLLLSGEKVLATGLPCQIAALYQYLHRNYDNLLTVDLICHSVASPMVFEKYIDSLEKNYSSCMVSYHPKNKEFGGWHKYAFKATFENGKVYHRNGNDDNFTRLFVGGENICARYSCFECPFKTVPQASDITIGDFWGIEKIDPSFDSPAGVSKLVVNSRKGKRYLDSLDCFEIRSYSIESSIYGNPSSWTMLKPASRPDERRRKRFMRDIQVMPFDGCVSKYCQGNIINVLRSCLKEKIRSVKKYAK